MSRFAITYRKGAIEWVVEVTADDEREARELANEQARILANSPGGTRFKEIAHLESPDARENRLAKRPQ